MKCKCFSNVTIVVPLGIEREWMKFFLFFENIAIGYFTPAMLKINDTPGDTQNTSLSRFGENLLLESLLTSYTESNVCLRFLGNAKLIEFSTKSNFLISLNFKVVN